MRKSVFQFLILGWLYCFGFTALYAQTQPRLVLPIGHTDRIKSAFFSPNSSLIVTSSNDNTVRIWDTETGKELQILTGHTDVVNSALFSPDGKLVLSVSRDNTARIWNAETGKLKQTLYGPIKFDSIYNYNISYLVSAVFNTLGNRVLAACSDNTFHIWDELSGKKQHTLIGDTNALSFEEQTVVFSPDGRKVLSSWGNIARIWDSETGRELQTFISHTNAITSAVFDPDGTRVLTASWDSTACIWDVESGRLLNTLSVHTTGIGSAIFSPDGNLIMTVSKPVNAWRGHKRVQIPSWDKTVRIWDANTGKLLQSIDAHASYVLYAKFSLDGEQLVTASSDSSARIWDTKTGKLLFSLIGHDDEVHMAEFSPDTKRLLTVSNTTVNIWDVKTGKKLKTLTGATTNVKSTIFCADGKLVITEIDDTKTSIWDVNSGRGLYNFVGCNTPVLSHDGKRVLVACSDSTARIWDAETGKELQILPGYTYSNAFSPDGKYVCTVDTTNVVRIWDSKTAKQIHSLVGHRDLVSSATFRFDGKRLLTEDFSNSVRIWNLETGKELICVEGSISALFSPDGKMVLTPGIFQPAGLYDSETGKKISSIYLNDEIDSLGTISEITRPYFSPDSKSLLIYHPKHPIFLTDLSTGARTRIKSGGSPIRHHVFSSDSKKLMIWNENDSVQIWDTQNGYLLITIFCKSKYYPRFSADENFIIALSDTGTIRTWDMETGLELQNMFANYRSKNPDVFFSDAERTLSTIDHRTILSDSTTGKSLYTRLQLKGDDWLVYDEDHRFDGSPGAIEQLYFVCGLEVVELGQMKDALYVPGLAEKILNGEDINYKKLSDLDICGALPVIEKKRDTEKGWEFSIEQRRWPIVRLEVKVDSKTVMTIPASALRFAGGKSTLTITKEELNHHLRPGEENKVTVVAFTEDKGVEYKSRGLVLEVAPQGQKEAPSLYMLMIGVNDYKDDALDLRFPVQDARAFGRSLESSAQKLLGKDKVFVYNVQSKADNYPVFTTPERAGVMKALQDIGSKARTNDVLFIFFAGHGVMQGTDNTFTFLTADASKINPVGISTTDLKEWLSPEGPFKMMPNKTVLVYDACNSGQAAKEIYADLAMARDDDRTERQRQIEDLGDKQGVFILSASAPNQSAYELPHLGQGLLTYSLLYTLKNNPAVIDEGQNGKGFLNLQKWFLETEREQARLMTTLGLKQQAQPYGTANIRIGLVDDEVRSSITLMAEKPLVFCSSARNENEEDPLELKEAVNGYLEAAMSRGSDTKVAYITAETPQANVLKLIYSAKGNTVQCRILLFKNKVKTHELNLQTTATKAAEEIVKAVEGVCK